MRIFLDANILFSAAKTDGAIRRLLALIAEAVRSLPEKVRPVLAAAIQLGCQVLVTGDRTHFGALYGKTLGGVKIHSPRSLAEMLLA